MSSLSFLRERRSARPLRWKDFHVSEAARHPRAVAKLLSRRWDGITLSGVFTANEIAAALPVLESQRSLAEPQFFGSMLGMPLAQGGHDVNARQQLFDHTDASRALYREAFGFDPHQRVVDVLRPMCGPLELEPPLEQGRAYNPGNIRWYEPGEGGLQAHVGNEFRERHKEWGYAQLLETTHVTDHLSYFVMLQEPEEGGALSVFDLLWETYPPSMTTPWTNVGRDDQEFDERDAVQFTPAPGEMILFGGGWRWHRVDDIGGSLPRITYGGFMAPSTDGRSLHVWC